jgi:RNA polymerase sigma-70 factor (ECF subfamily)
LAEPDWLLDGFEKNRARLQAVAYRMLGSFAEAQDGVQQAWLQASRADPSQVQNLDAWLTTIIVRVCLNALRSRNARREEPIGVHVPDPVISPAEGRTPEDEVLLADSVGLALQVVLETLSPTERVVFVLHDLFDLTFDEIAPIVGRTAATTRQLASRARRRVRGADVRSPDPDLSRQREVVDAFFAAVHQGDFEALVGVLSPDVVLRSDGGTAWPEASLVLRGASAVAHRTLEIANVSLPKLPVLVNGAAGVVVTFDNQPVAVMGFIVSRGKVAEVDAIIDPERVRHFNLPFLTD